MGGAAMVLLTAAVLWTVACVVLAWAQPRRVGAIARGAALGPAPPDEAGPAERAAHAARGCEHGWQRELAEGLAEAEGEPERVTAAEMALATAEHALRFGAGWPRVALWLCAAGGMLSAAVAVLLRAWWSLGPVVGTTLLGMVACVWARRATRRRAAAARGAVDDLVAFVLGDLYHRPVSAPQRRRMRWQRHRGRGG